MRSKLSTRVLGSKKKATLFGLKKRRYLNRKSDAIFLPYFEDVRKHDQTHLVIKALQIDFYISKFNAKTRQFRVVKTRSVSEMQIVIHFQRRLNLNLTKRTFCRYRMFETIRVKFLVQGPSHHDDLRNMQSYYMAVRCRRA